MPNLTENTLVPELAVTSYPASRRFYTELAGFTLAYERPAEGFGFFTLGGAQLMLDEIGKGRDFDPAHLPLSRPFGRGVNLQIAHPDLSGLLNRTKQAKTPLVLPVEERWYRVGTEELGQRQCIVADPDGYLLRFYEEIGARPLRV